MASAAKRAKTESDSEALQTFMHWCNKVSLTLSDKVYLSKEGTVAGYGMVAKDDIEEGEVLFSIPRTTLLSQHTTQVKTVLEEGKADLESTSGWVPLLMALMWEYTSPESHWRPYLDLWSDFKALDLPMFWSKCERDSLLQGTGIIGAVDMDLTNIHKEYDTVVLPFFRSHPALWEPDKHTLELYKSLVAFVMAYSFQEPVDEEEDDDEEKDPNPPMMVPMADMLNHVSQHNANLVYAANHLTMVSTRPIKAGEEVFNTYGQMANWQLLHMYGFTEPFPNNCNDTADIQMCSMYRAAEQVTEVAEQKWNLLCNMEMVGEEGAFIFSHSGSLTYTELYNTLKILCMSAEQVEELKENDGWEEVEENEEEKMERAFTMEAIPALSLDWRKLLHRAICVELDGFRGDLQADRELLESPVLYDKLSRRERNALQVRYGQKVILQTLQELTQT